MSLCPLLPLVTHPHSSAYLRATCNHLGMSSGTSLGRSHTRGNTASLLGPAGTLHTRLHLSRNREEIACSLRVCLTYASHDQAKALCIYTVSNQEGGDVWDNTLRKQGMQLLSLRLLSVFRSLSFAFWASWTLTQVEQLLENSSFKMLLNQLHLKSNKTVT